MAAGEAGGSSVLAVLRRRPNIAPSRVARPSCVVYPRRIAVSRTADYSADVEVIRRCTASRHAASCEAWSPACRSSPTPTRSTASASSHGSPTRAASAWFGPGPSDTRRASSTRCRSSRRCSPDRRISFFTDVANLPLRPPAVLAKAAASLDVLSDGRFELGLGAGGYLDQIAGMGGPRRPRRVRGGDGRPDDLLKDRTRPAELEPPSLRTCRELPPWPTPPTAQRQVHDVP